MTVWDGVARHYSRQERWERPSWRSALLLAAPGPADVVLDLGCGPGTAVRMWRRAGLVRPDRMVGVDASPAMLKRARSAGGTVARADGARLPISGGSVDLVVCAWLLHVLRPRDRRACLGEIARVLQADGRAVVVVPAVPATRLGRLVRAAARTLTAGSGVLTPPAHLDVDLATAGLVVHTDVVTRWGYAARVLLLRHRP